ncbi:MULTISPECIES: phosphotransferase [unclassified Variovorax]|jgi:Ser/Thr protein kinase RdoA (MazF antagonist)|uniref:phosphotransferase enzyme family protein n=1 Tax=unclassified Variovorax TaxID=663243 RepID=UPI000F7F6CA9|nr:MULTISPECIES: phosphotransferase [unclassified Variovorax]RSZ47308.1 aminoglycoside phosphotransferase [Variovorax sp. 553]RSZ48569.1 aminoglycoside phosphotransferase [Variovorax sp. 679]
MELEIAQSTPTAAGIAKFVQARYDLGEVIESEFLRRSFNQVYRLGFADGRRVVARLSAERPRGDPNVLFEAAALEHLARAGCRVSRCLPAANGEVAVQVPLPEGSRALMLFEHLDGEFTGDSAEDIRAFAQGLATLHVAGETYEGPGSAYSLDLDYLLLRPLQGLLRAPTMTAELRPQFEQLGERLHADISALGALRQVLCHGDAHGGNNFIVRNAQEQCEAVFFDFDETGPGYLAYELAVYPWLLHPRTTDGVLSDKAKTQWKHFISAYREARPVAGNDLAAVPRFMAVRQFWMLGENAGRVPVWGSQAMPTSGLRRQLTMLRAWEKLELPL